MAALLIEAPPSLVPLKAKARPFRDGSNRKDRHKTVIEGRCDDWLDWSSSELFPQAMAAERRSPLPKSPPLTGSLSSQTAIVSGVHQDLRIGRLDRYAADVFTDPFCGRRELATEVV
jgi:hypothetical protein